MRTRPCRGIAGALVSWMILTSACVGAGEAISPPFGLTWGDSPARLLDWAARMRLDQTVKVPADRPRLKILTIGSPGGTLPEHDASMIEAHFLDGLLTEVTLHYTYPGRPAPFVRGKFAELKRLLATRHGAFQPAGVNRTREDGIAKESEAFQLHVGRGSHLLLALTEVRDLKRGDAAARFSVVYHHDGEKEDSEATVIIRRENSDLPAVPAQP